MAAINLADAKAHLSDVIDRVVAGESLYITRRGKAVARISAAEAPRQRIDFSALLAMTERMPVQAESASDFIRWMRDEDRY
jgi:prevent-host-death family protein